MKKIKNTFLKLLDPLFLFASVLFCFLSLLFTNLKIYTLSSLSFYGTVILTFLWLLFRGIFNHFKPQNKKLFYATILSCLVIGICTIISLINTRTVPSFHNLSFVLILIVTFISIYLTITGSFSKYIFYFLVLLSLFYSCALLILYLTGFAKVWQSIYSYGLLTLNFSNANLAGIVLICVIFIDLIGIFIFKHIWLKVVSLIISLACVVLVILTSARNPFIAIGFSFVFTVLIVLDRKKRCSKPISLLAACLPLIVISFYFIYFKIKVPDGNVINYAEGYYGKPISSRYFLWCGFILSTKKDVMSFLFGSYISAGNCHNSCLTLLYTYGLFGLIAGIFLFTVYINEIISKNQTKRLSQMFGLLFIFSFFFLGVAEASPVLTSNGMFTFLLIGILMIKIPLSKSLFAERFEVKNKKPSILVISNVYGTGSIGKIVQDCHLYYLNKGLNAFVAYGRGYQSEDSNVVCLESLFDVLLTKLLMKITKQQAIGSYLMTTELLKCIDDIRPSIVHITALNDQFVNYKILLKYLRNKKIPVVYSHHSEYMYLGYCGGHAYNCPLFSEYNYSCSNCNKYSSRKIFNTKLNLIKSFDNRYFLTTSVSPWLHDRAVKSEVFKGVHDYVVMNGSSIERNFSFEAKQQLLSELNIAKDKKIILHVTPSMLIKTKKSMDFVRLCELNPELEFILITYNPAKGITIPKNLHIIENVSDKATLALYYSVASLTVLTGTSETFSMPVIESLLCGTPVLGYECGGPESIAISQYSNFVKNGDLVSLNKEMRIMLQKSFNSEEVSKAAKELYSTKIMAENYINVYEKLGLFSFTAIEI